MEFCDETLSPMFQTMDVLRTLIALFLSPWYIFEYFSDEKLNDTKEGEVN